MQVRFLGQGLERDGFQLGNVLHESLTDEKYTEFFAFVAFMSEGGVDRLRDSLATFTAKSENTACFYVGVDNKATSKEALEALLELEVPSYVFHTSDKSVIFHPKVYVFKGPEVYRIITGSSNFTTTGLFRNVEASLVIDSNYLEGAPLLSEVEQFFSSFISGSDPNIIGLDQVLIDRLERLGLVPSEASPRYAGEISHDIQENRGDSNEDGLKADVIFPKRAAPLAPPRTTKKSSTTTTATGSTGGGGTTTATGSTDGGTAPATGSTGGGTAPATGSTGGGTTTPATGVTLWFESGKLTGGSSNILDLSLTGRSTRSGGLQLLNPRMTNDLPITIRFNEVDYFDNIVKFPVTPSGVSNGTWRLQLKGRSLAGRRFTDHTRQGQLKDKILVFNMIAPDHYELSVEPLTSLSHYQSVSSFVDQSPPKGRFYGRI